jgi:nucleotide-binding universal stress UspA family protein
MFSSILIPLDGSWFGEHAIPSAVSIARRTGARIHLVHVRTDVAFPVAVESLPYLGTHVPIVPAEGDDEYVRSLAERLSETGLDVRGAVRHGPLAESLQRHATDVAADLVVACTHCHEGFSRYWHRGVGVQLVSGANLPTLLIRADETRPDLLEARTFRHVLIPLDGSGLAESAVAPAAAFAKSFGARITLLRAVRPVSLAGLAALGEDVPPDPSVVQDQREAAESYLDSVAQRLRDDGLTTDTRVVVGDEPATAIVHATRPDLEPGVPPIDLIVMGTRCRGRILRALVSSVSDEVLHNAPIPLLLHHPSDEPSLPDPTTATDRRVEIRSRTVG